MADFERALRKVLRHEGVQFDPNGRPIPGRTGYVNHPDDPGGETNFGVTVKEARANGFEGPMADLPYSIVLRIYRSRYWDLILGDQQPDQEIAEELFDTGVNCGIGTSVRFLQRALNVLNKRGTLYPDVVEDGRLGPGTIGALRKALAVASWYRAVILKALDCLQGERYMTLAVRDSKFESFVPGWLRNRVGVES